jgi:sensor histidine kinase YesM
MKDVFSNRIELLSFWMRKSAVNRVAAHSLFWIVWLSRTFYDLVTLYGFGGSIFFLLIYAACQVPMVYAHLYLLVPRLLYQRRYILYMAGTAVLLVAYSAVNFFLLQSIPSSVLPVDLFNYINNLNPQFDVFEGMFALIVTYSLKYAWQSLRDQNRVLQLQKDNLTLQLNLLKAQINPHFLFNTLNNLYALSLEKSDRTPDMILKLSDLMRYVLYETNSGKVAVEKEIAFLKNYIELEKIRHAGTTSISFHESGEYGNLEIEPMLLIPFVENCFKHGVHTMPDGNRVEIELQTVQGVLNLKISNNFSRNGKSLNGRPGIGVENVRQRLSILYPDKHRLLVTPDENIFTVELTINLN